MWLPLLPDFCCEGALSPFLRLPRCARDLRGRGAFAVRPIGYSNAMGAKAPRPLPTGANQLTGTLLSLKMGGLSIYIIVTLGFP